MEDDHTQPTMRSIILLIFAFLLSTAASGQWVRHSVNTPASFRGLSVVNERVVWASGTDGTVIRTIDGGTTWDVIVVPGAEKLDFRDIEAFDAKTAYIVSIGNGEDSRIYKTTDGGHTWKLQFKNANRKAFFDAIACWDSTNCIAMSDPVDHNFVLVNTTDGGAHWKPIDTSKMPATKDGEAAFAASGTCLIAQGRTNAFLVSGGSDARVFRSADRGLSWSVADTPIVKGTSGSGIFSIAMYDEKIGVIVGGNYEEPDRKINNLALTMDSGKTWTLGNRLGGYRSSIVFIDRRLLFAVGTNGSDFSKDGGKTWNSIDSENYNTVQSKGKKSIWAVGPHGRVARFRTITSATFDLKFP
jgi:photosystem II stability/assembly factor-like uncharacterized protein